MALNKYQAIQFDGSARNAHEVMEFIHPNGDELVITAHPISHIRIKMGGEWVTLAKGDWIARNELGEFKKMSGEEIEVHLWQG